MSDAVQTRGQRVERESSRVAEREMTEEGGELEESLNPPLSCSAAADPLMQQSHLHTGAGTTSCRGSAAWTSSAKWRIASVDAADHG